MVASRSYIITAVEGERDRILAAAADLFDQRRQADGDAEVVDLPYVTRAFRGIRP